MVRGQAANDKIIYLFIANKSLKIGAYKAGIDIFNDHGLAGPRLEAFLKPSGFLLKSQKTVRILAVMNAVKNGEAFITPMGEQRKGVIFSPRVITVSAPIRVVVKSPLPINQNKG
jgi:hypothetical protein